MCLISLKSKIAKDLLRTFPTNVFFNKLEDEGVQRCVPSVK